MKNVLIVTESFPPVEIIAAQRFGAMVVHLMKLGWRPYVLTTKSAGEKTQSVIPEDRVVRIGYHPTTAESERPVGKTGKVRNFLRFIKLIQALAGFRLFTIDRTFFTWYRRSMRVWRFVAPRTSIDAIVASYGPPAALWIGHRLARLYRVPWIADFRDIGAARRRYDDTLISRIDRFIESRLVRSASYLTTVSPSLRHWLEETYRKPCFVIYNGYDEAVARESSALPPERPSYLYYAGRFYEHQIDSVILLLEAVRSLPMIEIRVRSLGPDHLERRILDAAISNGVQKRVRILPPTDHARVELERAAALLNVVVEDLSEECAWSTGTLTGKFLQLLPHRPPVLAIARSDSDIGMVLSRTEKGRLCSTKSQVITTIQQALKQDDFGRGNAEVYEYAKSRQASTLCNLLDNA